MGIGEYGELRLFHLFLIHHYFLKNPMRHVLFYRSFFAEKSQKVLFFGLCFFLVSVFAFSNKKKEKKK